MNCAKAIIRSRSFATPGVNDAFLNVRGRYWGPVRADLCAFRENFADSPMTLTLINSRTRYDRTRNKREKVAIRLTLVKYELNYRYKADRR